MSVARARRVRERASLTEEVVWRTVRRAILLLVGLVLAVTLVTQLMWVLVELFLAMILAAAMTPPVDRITAFASARGWRWQPPRVAVVVLLYLILIVLIVAVGGLILGQMILEIRAFATGLPGYVTALESAYQQAVARPDAIGSLLGSLNLGAQIGSIAQQALNLANQTLSVVWYLVGVAFGALDVLMVLVMALYLTADATRIRRYLIDFLPPERDEQADRLSREIATRLGGWARGQVLLCLIIGVLAGLGLAALGVPYALLLGLLAGILEAVPTLGPVIAAVPAVAVVLVISPWQAPLVAALYLVIQQSENYLIVPRVMSRAVSLHPLVVLLALLSGGQMMGVIGAVLAVPFAAALSVVVDEVRRERLALR